MSSSASQQGRALSGRQLTFLFFVAVAVCAIFFALGFLTGANHRSASVTPSVEQVPPPSVVPPPVNAPLEPAATRQSQPQGPTVIEQDLKQPSQPEASKAPEAAAARDQRATSRQTGAKETGRAAVTEAPPPPAAPTARRGIMVQVAALRTQQDAQSLLAVLESRGYHAVVVTPAEAQAGDNLYRVQVGPFGSRANAVKTLHKLSNDGFRPFIREQ